MYLRWLVLMALDWIAGPHDRPAPNVVFFLRCVSVFVEFLFTPLISEEVFHNFLQNTRARPSPECFLRRERSDHFSSFDNGSFELNLPSAMSKVRVTVVEEEGRLIPDLVGSFKRDGVAGPRRSGIMTGTLHLLRHGYFATVLEQHFEGDDDHTFCLRFFQMLVR